LQNPFTIGIARKEIFCNREKEIKDLITYARGGSNVILTSPRRFGKTSLVHIVLEKLKKEGFLTAYIDLFPISSERDFIARFYEGIIEGIGKGISPQTLFNRIKNIFKRIVPSIEVKEDGFSFQIRFSGTEEGDVLLDDVMEGLYRYVKKHNIRACIALDEFQEITELPSSRRIEGILRSHMQLHNEISYFYIGSRRGVIKDMFTDKKRPFYKSAFLYFLNRIPRDSFVKCIIKAFEGSGKKCNTETASYIYDIAEGYPYYVQKLSLLAWDLTKNRCTVDIVKSAFEVMIETEKLDFESIWSSLTMSQKSLLRAIAIDPSKSIYSKEYLSKHNLSVGGIQKAIKTLLSKDLIEKDDQGIFRVTDPIFKRWLTF